MSVIRVSPLNRDAHRLELHNASPKIAQAPARIDPDLKALSTFRTYDSEQGGWPVLSRSGGALAVTRGLAKAGPWFGTDPRTGEPVAWVDQRVAVAWCTSTVPTLTSSTSWTVEVGFTASGYASGAVNQRIFAFNSTAGIGRISTAGNIEFYDGVTFHTAASDIATLLGVSDWEAAEARFVAAGTSLDIDVRVPDGSWVSAVSGATITAVAVSGATVGTGGNDVSQGLRGHYRHLRVRDGDENAATVALFTPDLFAAGNRANGNTAVDAHGVTWTITRPSWSTSTDIGRRLPSRSTAYIALPGVAGEYVSTPDQAAFHVDDDLDLTMELGIDDITPASTQTLAAQWEPGQRAFEWKLFEAGDLQLTIETAGGGTEHSFSGSKLPALTGDTIQVRTTRIHSTGVIQHYYRHASADAWTELGAADTLTSGDLTNATGALMVGAHWTNGSVRALDGRVVSFDMLIGGSQVCRVAAADANPDSSTWTDPVTGQTNTINRSSSVQYHAEVMPANVEAWQSDGVNDFLTVIGDDSMGDYDPSASVTTTLLVDARLHAGAGSNGRLISSANTTNDDGPIILRSGTNERVNGFLRSTSTVNMGSGSDNITYGQRFQAVAAFDNANSEFYVDGASIATDAATSPNDFTATVPVTIGADPNGTDPGAATFFGVGVIKRRVSDSDALTISNEGLSA